MSLSWKQIAAAILVLLAAAFGLVWAAGHGAFGSHEGPGEIVGPRLTPVAVASRARADATAARTIGASRAKQVLFGDLHVHTTFSFDAFSFSLPLLGGEGAHPPADACDFARYCSSLDFWSINDHASSITPRHWTETVESIRQCNAVAGDPADPDVVAYLGWEWTQVGKTPEEHYGHKNVVLAHLEDERIPARPIAALRSGIAVPPPLGLGVAALRHGGRLHDFALYLDEVAGTPRCPDDVPTRELPSDCIEGADTPADLFRKLDEWDHEALVIPHGTTWGMYTPPGSTWDKQLVGPMHDPKWQRLIEVYSGHGDSEVHRPFRAVTFDADGTARCPEPSPDYLPSCWRAGEIIRERCASAGEPEDACARRAEEARAHAANAGVAILHTVPGTRAADWLDAGQCRDCDQPSFNYRPGGSAQYIVALGGFEEGDDPRRFRLGFMASSDNHYARPGTGYKEVHRRGMTESQEAEPGGPAVALIGAREESPVARSRPYRLEHLGFDVFEVERQASFLLTGGLVGAHATGRDREAIFEALSRREVYGTSGPRMLLWFDLVNPPGSRGETLPMGGEVEMQRSPVFQVRAVGSFEQKPGCPEDAATALGEQRLEHLCMGECYHPGDRRRPITRVEIVRIVPQATPDEEIALLIDDPWQVFECEPDPVGCAATFIDPEYTQLGRDAVYYARAYEAPKPGINAANLRCERGADGECERVHPCPGPEGREDDCLAPHEPRAWSSPIYVDFGGS